MSTQDDDWLIDDEPTPDHNNPQDTRPWRILIVDDEKDVHSVTRLALGNVIFKGRGLELISAYSGSEAFRLLQETGDIALVLLDVVMESDDAGLRLVERIRNGLNNPLVRIVLRTGQPGQAPEQKVILEYDINDYKAKTELTTQKLFTTVIASLRAYEGLVMIERSRVGLGKILEGATNLYQIHSLQAFSSGVLHQISAILDVGADGVLCVLQDHRPTPLPHPRVIAAIGDYATLQQEEYLPATHQHAESIARAFQEKRSLFLHPVDVLFIQTQQGHEFAISMTPSWPLADYQKDLLEIFCNRIAAAFDNLYLYSQLQKAQEATVVALAGLAEFRDNETGEHVNRVQQMTHATAHKLQQRGVYPDQLDRPLLEMIGIASILHDVGKVATPDNILLKPGIHTPDERTIMQLHAKNGETILDHAAQMVDGPSYLLYGAQIAGGHHEHFDGTGYPRGLKGQEIPLSARIVAVVDVFDALLHRRPYKEPWPFDTAIDYIRQRRGTQFDPEVVNAFLDVVEKDQPEWLAREIGQPPSS